MPGTMTPEPEPVEQVNAAAFPAASTTEMCVVPPYGAGSSRLGARSTIRCHRVFEARVTEQLARQPAAAETGQEAVVTRACLLTHHLDQRCDRADTLGACTRQPLEQRQAVEDQDAAGGRRRVRDDLVAAEAHAQWPSPHDAVGGEIVARQVPAAVGHRAHDRLRELAAVQGGSAFAGDLLERVAEIRKPELIPRDEP